MKHGEHIVHKKNGTGMSACPTCPPRSFVFDGGEYCSLHAYFDRLAQRIYVMGGSLRLLYCFFCFDLEDLFTATEQPYNKPRHRNVAVLHGGGSSRSSTCRLELIPLKEQAGLEVGASLGVLRIC